jgi:hypothetical protein
MFGKKKDKTNKTSEKSEAADSVRDLKKSPLKSNEYIVQVFDPWGQSKILRRRLIAKRYEYDDGVVVLRSEKENFEEIFPSVEESGTFLNKKDDVLNKLKAEKTKLQNILQGKDKTTNIKNVRYDIFMLEANLQKIRNGSNPAFMSLDGDNNQTFEFIRKGSTYHPIANDLDTSRVYVPSDYKKKKSAMTVRNKKEKYSKYAKGIVTVGSIIILIAGMILFIGNAFWSYKLYTYADSESSIAKINARFDNAAGVCLDTIKVQNIELAKTSEQVSDIAQDLQTHLKPVTVIEGERPVDLN